MLRSTLIRNCSPHLRILEGKYVQLHFSHLGRSKFTSTQRLNQESVTAGGTSNIEHDNSTGDHPVPVLDLSFNSAKEAYRSKTTPELLRALFVFNMCSIPFLVNNNKIVRSASLNYIMAITCYELPSLRLFA